MSTRKWVSLLLTPPTLSCISYLSHSFRSGHWMHWGWPKGVSPSIWGRKSLGISSEPSYPLPNRVLWGLRIRVHRAGFSNWLGLIVYGPTWAYCRHCGWSDSLIRIPECIGALAPTLAVFCYSPHSASPSLPQMPLHTPRRPWREINAETCGWRFRGSCLHGCHFLTSLCLTVLLTVLPFSVSIIISSFIFDLGKQTN